MSRKIPEAQLWERTFTISRDGVLKDKWKRLYKTKAEVDKAEISLQALDVDFNSKLSALKKRVARLERASDGMDNFGPMRIGAS